MGRGRGVHGVQYGDSPAAAGTNQAIVSLQGQWDVISINCQHENEPDGEPGRILLQQGTVYNADAIRHWKAQGLVQADYPLIHSDPFTLVGSWLIVAEVEKAAAVAHRVTVVADKIAQR